MSLYKAKNFFHSLCFASNGIMYALKTQRNLRIHVVIALLILIVSMLLNISLLEWPVIILCIILIFFSEMINTVVETLIDLYYKDEYSPVAKNAKDVAAGAVLISALGVAIIGMIIFIPKILLIVTNWLG